LKPDAEIQALDWESFIDPGIVKAVRLLNANGIYTFESCEGGSGHSYPEPTVRFHGDRTEGFKAVAVALQHALPVISLRRIWQIIEGEPTGPYWEMVFRNRL
jgi:hypothetical protein